MKEKSSRFDACLSRAYAIVLVSFLIAAGSLAMAPAILAAPNSGNNPLVVTEFVGPSPIQVDVSQSTPAICFAGAKIPVLQIDIMDMGGFPDIFDELHVLYTGTDPIDIQPINSAELWMDVDGNGIYNPLVDVMVAPTNIAGVFFDWFGLGLPVFPGPGPTSTYWVLLQTDNAATALNIVDALVIPGGIVFVGPPPSANVGPMDPNDPPDFCTIQSNIGPPQAIYGYVKMDDMVTPIPGVPVTVLDTATGETLGDVSDALGRYDVDMNDMLFGYANGDFVEVTTPAPNQGYNYTFLVVPSGGQQVDVIVDDTPPVINFTVAAPLYVNTQGTFGGTGPPVNMQAQVWDLNIAAAAMGVRNEDTGAQPNNTFYMTYNFTTTTGNFAWDGSWYFIAGGGNEEIVTTTFSDAFGTDMLVFGEINGASVPGQVIGYTASHYVVFDQFGAYQSTWVTQGTLRMNDDVQIFPGGADTFRPYKYEGGQGYIAGVNTYTFIVNPVLNMYPIVDGRYTVVTGAIDTAQNTNWTNEADGNPVITVDNYAPDADATGPAGSDVYAFDVTYAFTDVVAPNGAPTSPVVNVTLWYSFNAGAWTLYGTDPTPGDGLFPVDVTLTSDGTYDWWMVSWDTTDNHELGAPAIEATTIVDTLGPTINPTTVDRFYINNQGTFGGTAPPVMVTSSVTDTNQFVAAWGIRNNLQIGNSTIYFSCNFTADPSTHPWDGSWYFIENVLVTANLAPEIMFTDLAVFGDLNNATINTGDVIGYVLPNYYAVFDNTGVLQAIYDTMGTVDYSDDVAVATVPTDYFRAFRYDEGFGFIATALNRIDPEQVGNEMALQILPIPDGEYAVVTSAMDEVGNTAWRNESDGDPVITVDNYAPIADATGPASSDVYAFDVTYAFNDVIAPNGAPQSAVVNVTLWYSFNAGAWTLFGTDPTPGDGLFPVDVTLTGDGTYDWWLVSWDLTDNHELSAPAIEATTIVDTLGPTINPTLVDKFYINNQGTFGGIAPPVQVTSSVTDPNLLVAAWGIRNNLQIGNSTIYFSCNFTIDPSTNPWDGSWYFIENVLVTANLAPEIMLTDLTVFGDLNNASINTGDVIGRVMPNYYAVFDSAGLYQGIYNTMGTLDYADDTQVIGLGPADYFRAFRYDEGPGFIATALNRSDPEQVGNEMALQILPIPDGDYAVVTSAMDSLGNTAWRNETNGDPVITVDNYAPIADATGPATSTVLAFDVTYAFNDVIAPNGATQSPIVNVTLWFSFNAGPWTLYGTDPTPGDGLFPVDVTLTGDGTYDWWMVSWDATDNHGLGAPISEAQTLVDTAAPVIGVTTVNTSFVNSQGTFNGIAPPVQVSTSYVEANVLVASIGIRNEAPNPFNETYYATYNFTATPTTWDWNCMWYFLSGGGNTELVTVTFSEAYVGDIIVWGEYNGANPPGFVYGNNMPPNYLLFQPGPVVVLYDTQGTIDVGDDTPIVPVPGDDFRPYIYEGGIGYITGLNLYSLAPVDPVLTGFPIIDGRYTVVVGVLDQIGNSAWTNEADGNPVITVDTIQPTLTTEYIISVDGGTAGAVDTGDTLTIWVNVTDVNEDATCFISVNVDEVGFPDQPVTGLAYMGLGVWQCTYVVQGPPLTTSDIDVSFRDLAQNLIDAPDNATYDIYGFFNLNYAVGWNLVSISVLNPTVGGVPFTNAYNFTQQGALMVSKWDFATQSYINFIAGFHMPGEPRDFALAPDEAYWIWMSAAGFIPFDGVLPGPRNVAVDGPGWNMVGYMDPINIGDVDTDWAPFVTCGAYDDIAYYDTGTSTFVHYIFAGTVMNLVPGRGYFVWSDAPAVISY